MDSSTRHPATGGTQPPSDPAPTEGLRPLDLIAWLGARSATSREEAAAPFKGDRTTPERGMEGPGSAAGGPAIAPDARSSRSDARPGAPPRARDSRNGLHRDEARPPADPRRPDDRCTRAAAYLAKIPPAVAGQRGHDRTFHAACVLIQGFELTINEARPLLEEWNLGCVPPWSPAELEHKLRDAEGAAGSRPRGYLYDQSKSRTGSSLRRDRPHGLEPASLSPAHHFQLADSPHTDSIPIGQEANPHRLAHQFIISEFACPGGVSLRYWRDEFHIWDKVAYHPVPATEMRAQTTRWIADEFERLYRMALAEFDGKNAIGPLPGTGTGAEPPRRSGAAATRVVPRPIPVTGRVVSDVLQALASLVMVSSRTVPMQPAWIPAWPSGLAAPGDGHHAETDQCALNWLADQVLPAKNAIVHLPSLVAGLPCTSAPSPCYFNAHALEYDFDPAAPAPREWLRFLDEIWGADAESIAALQEWFGYLLTPDTRYQKILMMVGPKRSGRGTIARILKALAGSNTVVNPTLSTLARPFGLSTLIGKPIAVFPDARLSSRPDNAAIVECLLSISGEDDQTIDRKHLPAWTGKLSTRFVLISNELPRLRDVSGALAGRLIILRFTRSFYGREDMALFERLRPELPGILRWALSGWERLNRRGRFIQPRSARSTRDDDGRAGQPDRGLPA